MKKTILNVVIIATSALLTITGASAQTGFQFGVQATPHLSWLMNSDDKKNTSFDYVTTFGGSAGINLQYGFMNDLGIGLDAIYSMQGQRFKLSGVEDFKKVNYVKIPLMLIYNYQSSEMVTMCYKIGPQLGILTDAKLTDKKGNTIVDQTKAYQDMEFGAVVSAGVGIKLMKKMFLDIAARYDYGFTNAENNNYLTHINHPLTPSTGNSVSTSRPDTHNSTVGLTVGLRWLCSKE
jgi:opacity protein-like surface antigen